MSEEQEGAKPSLLRWLKARFQFPWKGKDERQFEQAINMILWQSEHIQELGEEIANRDDQMNRAIATFILKMGGGPITFTDDFLAMAREDTRVAWATIDEKTGDVTYELVEGSVSDGDDE